MSTPKRQAYDAAYYQAHRAERDAFGRAHPEYGRRYRERHGEEIVERARLRRKADPERHRAKNRAWRAAHPNANREGWLRHRGCPPEVYDALLVAQDGVCAICRQPESLTFKGTIVAMAVDHDHACCPGYRSCGECIRGLLCNGCNTGLGKFRDDPTLLVAAIEYLASA